MSIALSVTAAWLIALYAPGLFGTLTYYMYSNVKQLPGPVPEESEQPPPPDPPPPDPPLVQVVPDDDALDLFEQQRKDEWNQEQEQYEKQVHEFDFRLRDVVEDLVGHVNFTSQRRLVGHVIRQREVDGIKLREVGYPADDFIVRPITAGNLAELAFLLPGEKAFPQNIRRIRFLSGEALVRVPAEITPLTEEIHVPQYKTHNQVLYVLWDASPSMFPEYMPWRRPVWEAILLRLQDKALRANVPLYMRPFGWDVGRLRKSVSTADAMDFRRFVQRPSSINGTDISRAVQTSIADFSDFDYDEGDIIILTDGEDSGLNPENIRKALESRNLRLHAIMLGVENDALRACADVYQIVEEDLTVHLPVHREPQ